LDTTGGQECYEEAFIDMLKMLTTENRWGNHEQLHCGRVDTFVELTTEIG
jgi:hypothetical protein